MNSNNRFLNISYLVNTGIIKSKAIWLKMTRGNYPFAFFKEDIQNLSVPKYELNFQDEYMSLSYLDFRRGEKLHSGNLSITQRLILGLVYYNGTLNGQNSVLTYLTDLATKLESEAAISEEHMIFYIDEAYSRFGLSGKYYSGLVQGKAASFFLRCYSLTKDESFKKQAKKCLQSAWKNVDEGGVLIDLPHNNIWIEEYPSPNPSMVLNGFLFYLIGLTEYLSFENDQDLSEKLDACLRSVVNCMPNYKVKNGLLYSMYRWSLCNVHYTGIMKYQFEHLYKLTGLEIFKEYMEFTDTLTNWNTFDNII